jgi:hypothetical protein
LAEPPAPRARHLGYEPKDVSVRWVVGIAIGGASFVALSAAALYGLQRLYSAADVAEVEPPPIALERRHAIPPPPRLQAEPAEDLATYLAREKALLESYAWVDEEAGIARIPIEQAMQLLAQRGWPEPATGRPPPPGAVEGLDPWPDWNGGAAARRRYGRRCGARAERGRPMIRHLVTACLILTLAGISSVAAAERFDPFTIADIEDRLGVALPKDLRLHDAAGR